MSNTPPLEQDPFAVDDAQFVDPWDLDLNAPELIGNQFLPEPQLAVKLQAIKVEDQPDSQKPCKKITFKIIEGQYQDYIVTDYFYGTHEARWRLRELYIACGYCTTTNVPKDNGSRYVEETHVDRSKRPADVIGQCLIADCVKDGDSKDGKFYARLKSMRRMLG